MSEDGMLSQAEIDALLNGTAGTMPPVDDVELTEYERDALGEIGNISFGSAATVLSTLLQQRVEITTPTVTLIPSSSVNAEFPRPYVMVAVEYTAGLEGRNALAIELQDAKTIADLMLGGDGTNTAGELNELHLSAMAEAMNQMMGGAATALSSMFRRHINISPPSVDVVDFGGAEDNTNIGFADGSLVNISFRLRVGTLIDSYIMQLAPVEFAKSLVGAFVEQMNTSSSESAAPAPAQAEAQKATSEVAATREPVQQRSAPPPPSKATQDAQVARLTVVERPQFPDFNDGPGSSVPPRNLSLLFDVPLSVTVELGRTKRAVREILDLAPGAIVELDKLAGEPVDILVNNKKIAVGEVVVIDENFGVRVTDILEPADRIRNLHA